jgi:predicted nucleic-acid-binding protein
LPEKSTSVVDANVILRLLLNDEPRHFAQAKAFFDTVKAGAAGAHVPAAVLAECVYVLTKVYDVGRTETADHLLGLLDYRGVTTDSAAVRAALGLYRDRNVDFIDALVVATARENGWRVFSFDRDIVRLTR